MKTKFGWQTGAWALVIVAALWVIVQGDRRAASWVDGLSRQGGAAPAIDAHSPTGYVLGQREFLGTHERGNTYRWIARTQDEVASGPFARRTYQADNVPVGRPELAPRIYTWWLGALAWTNHAITGDSGGLAVERVAVWEPVISHLLVAVAVIVLMGARFGFGAAGISGLFFAFFPLFGGQFLPGVLTPRSWALVLAAYALASHLGLEETDHRKGFGIGAAITTALALWLDPAVGFPLIIVSAAVGAAEVYPRGASLPFRLWSMVGAITTLAAWFIDGATWSSAAGELRYVHPLYAAAWLGMGLALDGWQQLRQPDHSRWRPRLELLAAIPLVGALVSTQVKSGFAGWAYPAAAMDRLTSLDETTVFHGAFDWMMRAASTDRVFFSAPAVAAIVVLALAFWRSDAPRSKLLARALVVAGIVVLSGWRIRWAVVAALVAAPVIASTLPLLSAAVRRWAIGVVVIFLGALITWDFAAPGLLQKISRATDPTGADIDALIYRHCAHWLAEHNPGQKINALAPPELSDSLVFHGGAHVLMSTAWESYPGQVAASRFLSAPESTEAEAVLQSREITHVILPSWDKVLPLLVHQPPENDKTTLYSRLERWVFPPYLQPIPYHLPPVPGYGDQKLVVFKVVPPQDEALSLARLAEYFVEMNRDEPATLVAKVLAQSYPDDPNAAIARATVFDHVGNRDGFEREIKLLAADASAGRAPFPWDRRVQRAIIFALGERPDLESSEVKACLAEASDELLFTLTPLEAHRLVVLARRDGVAFPSDAMARLAERLGEEYSNRRGTTASP